MFIFIVIALHGARLFLWWAAAQCAIGPSIVAGIVVGIFAFVVLGGFFTLQPQRVRRPDALRGVQGHHAPERVPLGQSLLSEAEDLAARAEPNGES